MAVSLPVGAPLPSLSGASAWLNGGVRQEELRGRPVLVHFWAVSCPACKSNMPLLQDLAASYGSHGLAVVAVHLPRGQADEDIEAVTAAVKALRMTEPCAIDNQRAIGAAFETDGKWPWYFLFDAEGRLKRRAAGGFGFKMMQIALPQVFAAGRSSTV